MAEIHGLGILQPDDAPPLTGGFAAWQNPAPYTTVDWQTGGFTLCALWMRIFNDTPIRSWVEIGYTQGFAGVDRNLIYWAEGISGTYYEYAVAAPGPAGTNHGYMAVYDEDEPAWVVLLDGTAVGWSPQSPFGLEINVGGEMTSAQNTLTPTSPGDLAFKDTGTFEPWTNQPGAIRTVYDLPLRFTWNVLGVSGTVRSDAQGVEERAASGAPLWPARWNELPRHERFPIAPAPGASGGPFLSDAMLDDVALRVARAAGDPSARLLSRLRTTHGEAEKARGAGRTRRVAADREVVVTRFAGDFVFRRGRQGGPPLRGRTVEVEVDATDGSVLVWGTDRAVPPEEPAR